MESDYEVKEILKENYSLKKQINELLKENKRLQSANEFYASITGVNRYGKSFGKRAADE